MINKITFKNFKIFKKKQTLELKPITILIGKNNTGKSAVMKLPTMIEGALESRENLPIKLDNEGVILGNENKDLVYGKFSRVLELGLFQRNENLDREDFLRVNILVDSSNDKPILDYWKLNDELELRLSENEVYVNELDDNEYLCSFEGISLAQYFNKEKKDLSGTVFNQSFKLSTDFISGIRENAKKYYEYKGSKNSKSGIDGSNLYNFLIEDFLTTDKVFFNKIHNWIKEKFEGWEL